MQGNELISFQIIAAVGSARSMYVMAIQEAKLGHIEEAHKMIKEGEELFLQGHSAHAGLIQAEANGEKTEYSLLLMHAEDQLMTTELLKIVALEFIDVYDKEKRDNERD